MDDKKEQKKGNVTNRSFGTSKYNQLKKISVLVKAFNVWMIIVSECALRVRVSTDHQHNFSGSRSCAI